jgi:uncharacterized protein (DUF427 family)
VQPVAPGPGQESVWDYPRPPALDPSGRHVVVRLPSGAVLADTRRAVRVLETSHPPTWYLPPDDVDRSLLRPSSAAPTTCEFKGRATYWDVVDGAGAGGGGAVLHAAAWSYEAPTPGFTAITGYLSLRPDPLVCTVDGKRARPQEGGFYAGWITDDVVGPFKGVPGSWGW